MAINDGKTPLENSIAPWLTVPNSSEAVEFYKAAFGAIEVFAPGEGAGHGRTPLGRGRRVLGRRRVA